MYYPRFIEENIIWREGNYRHQFYVIIVGKHNTMNVDDVFKNQGWQQVSFCQQQHQPVSIGRSPIQIGTTCTRAIIIISMQYQTYNQYGYQEVKQDSLASRARLSFIKKVYSLLSVQLLVTFFMICLSNSSKSFLMFQHNNMWLAYLSMIVSVGTCVALACGSLSKKVPINYYLLAGFTIAEAYLVSFICTMYETKSVLFCGALTLGVTLGLTIHAMTTTKDYSAMMGAVYGMFFILVTISLLNFFIRSTFMNNALALGFSVIYLVYILIDTQLIIGKSNTRKLSLDDYIMGTMMLYVDIIGLFLKLLELFGERRRNKD